MRFVITNFRAVITPWPDVAHTSELTAITPDCGGTQGSQGSAPSHPDWADPQAGPCPSRPVRAKGRPPARPGKASAPRHSPDRRSRSDGCQERTCRKRSFSSVTHRYGFWPFPSPQRTFVAKLTSDRRVGPSRVGPKGCSQQLSQWRLCITLYKANTDNEVVPCFSPQSLWKTVRKSCTA